MQVLPAARAVTYPTLCEILAKLGYDDPIGDVEDQLLYFHRASPSSSRPKVITLVFPDHSVVGTPHLGWPRELMLDFLLTTFSGLPVDGGITITALLSSLETDESG